MVEKGTLKSSFSSSAIAPVVGGVRSKGSALVKASVFLKRKPATKERWSEGYGAAGSPVNGLKNISSGTCTEAVFNNP